MAEVDPQDSDERVGALRGAQVQVDARRVGQVVVAVCLATLLSLVVGLYIAAYHQNLKATLLHRDGVRVQATVTGCSELWGGTGSTLAGYQCTGAFVLDGHTHRDVIGGTSALLPSGETMIAVSVESDPTLLSTLSASRSEHSSLTAYIIPTMLLILLVAGSLWSLRWLRKNGSKVGPEEPAGPEEQVISEEPASERLP